MISSMIVALTLAQVASTEAETTGALNTLQATILSARRGERSITAPGSGKRICIRPIGALPSGTVVVRFGVALLAPSFAEFVGLPVHGRVPTTEIEPLYNGTVWNPETQQVEPVLVGTIERVLTTSERWKRSRDEHITIEVQAVPTTVSAYDRAQWTGNMDVIEAEVFTQGSAQWPVCEVAMFRNDDSGFDTTVRCACWDGSKACTWQRPNEGGGTTPVACPKGMTMGPGTFSGVGAVPKSCVARFDGPGVDHSWPSACPQR